MFNMKKVTYNGLAFEPFITREQIAGRIKELATAIKRDCKGKTPLFLCVLNGAFLFASDLFRAVDMDAEIAFVRLKSYDGTSTSGVVNEVMGLSEDITDRVVVVIEDIIDTGNTMKRLVDDYLIPKQPAAIKIATLLFKPEALNCDIKPDYVGFEISPKFIIGFGLDINGMARNLPDIYIQSDEK